MLILHPTIHHPPSGISESGDRAATSSADSCSNFLSALLSPLYFSVLRQEVLILHPPFIIQHPGYRSQGTGLPCARHPGEYLPQFMRIKIWRGLRVRGVEGESVTPGMITMVSYIKCGVNINKYSSEQRTHAPGSWHGPCCQNRPFCKINSLAALSNGSQWLWLWESCRQGWLID